MSGSATESLGLRLAALVALVLANAFFVAAEFALVAARRTRIEALVRRGDRKAKTVQTALQDLYRQLSAAQLGITVASILLGYVAERSEEHTSELQSPCNLVCRLLLEKKNKSTTQN